LIFGDETALKIKFEAEVKKKLLVVTPEAFADTF